MRGNGGMCCFDIVSARFLSRVPVWWSEVSWPPSWFFMIAARLGGEHMVISISICSKQNNPYNWKRMHPNMKEVTESLVMVVANWVAMRWSCSAGKFEENQSRQKLKVTQSYTHTRANKQRAVITHSLFPLFLLYPTSSSLFQTFSVDRMWAKTQVSE